jgi:hypothetical protein
MEVCFMGQIILRRWFLIGLLVLALGISTGCVTNEIASNADIVLAKIDGDVAPTGPIEFEGKTLVYSTDIANLVATVQSTNLDLREKIDCMLDDLEAAAKDDTTVQCHGTILVAKEGKHGLLSFDEITKEINSIDGELAKREYLIGYLITWDRITRINRVETSLAQIKRSNAIPVFGALIKTIHRFPILYEGYELVPKDDIPNILDQYSALDTEEARRTLVTDYLER